MSSRLKDQYHDETKDNEQEEEDAFPSSSVLLISARR